MREDLRELLDVTRGEVLGCLPVAVMQARDDLGAQKVDLAVQDAPPEGDLALGLRALVDQLTQIVVGQRLSIGVVSGWDRLVAGLDGQLLGHLREQFLGDDRRVDVDARPRAP